MPQVYVNIVLFLMENSPWMLFGWKLSRLLTFNHLSIECFDLTLSFACLPFTVIDFRGISFLSFYLYLLSFNLCLLSFYLYLLSFNLYLCSFYLYLLSFNLYLLSFSLYLLSFNLYLLSFYLDFFLPIPTFM